MNETEGESVTLQTRLRSIAGDSRYDVQPSIRALLVEAAEALDLRDTLWEVEKVFVRDHDNHAALRTPNTPRQR